MTYRVGRSLGRTIYRQVGDEPSKDDVFLGIMDTPALAEMVVDALNATEPRNTVEPPGCYCCSGESRGVHCRHCHAKGYCG